MGCGMTFVAVTEEQYDEVHQDSDSFYENIVPEAEDEDEAGLDREFSAVNFLLANWNFPDDDIDAPDYTDASWDDEIGAGCLDVDEVQGLAESFKEFTKSDFKRRFLSDKFKTALVSEEIYRGGEFGDEDYFEELWSSVEYLSAFVIRKAEQNKAIFIYYV